MKKLQDQINSVSKSLVNLSGKLEKISEQLDKLQPPKATTKKTKSKPAAKKTSAKSATVIDTVFDVIKRSRKGTTIEKLKEKTGLHSRQLSNALYKLSKKGLIKSKSRGLYVKK